jgi:hypothetical protein
MLVRQACYAKIARNMPDALHIAIALGPLATYLVALGLVQLSRRALVVSGARDAAALALAISGFVAAGPMELFLVEEAAVRYGAVVWIMMLAFYGLVVILVILSQRPRLVIYNITLDQLRPVLADVAMRLDSDARWAGESLVLPQLGVQLYLDFTPFSRNVQLSSASAEQNMHGWKHLEKGLLPALRKTRSTSRHPGLLTTLAGIALAVVVGYLLTRDPAHVLQAANEMLRR